LKFRLSLGGFPTSIARTNFKASDPLAGYDDGEKQTYRVEKIRRHSVCGFYKAVIPVSSTL
jgi:hypothetical protein